MKLSPYFYHQPQSKPQFRPIHSQTSLLCPLCCLILPILLLEILFKVRQKSEHSMASRFHNDQTSIFIEYCRSCETHSWCTHHDESKYHDTFLKFSEMMSKRLPHLQVVGNLVPQNLIPFKIAENKYIDANTNKYVVFPHIGSFEVTFQGKVIFSKKETHTWPNIPSIISKIASIVDPDYQSPTKQEENHEEDRETSKVSNNNSFLDSEEDKKTKYKVQQKGFTLTDHFKLYRPKNTFEDKEWLTEKQESEASLKQFSEMGRLESREKSNKSLQSKKSSDLVGQSKLKEMLKQKGAASKQQGKKEMIIRLDSIEEENAYEEAAMATQRTQEKNIKKNRMKEIDEQINSLQDKFKRFQNRVHDIQARNKDFEKVQGSADDKSRFKQIMENRQEIPRNLSTKKEAEKEKGLLADKTNKLEQYLTYSEQEKNDKLHRIYGEWKLIKQFSTKNKKLLKGKQRISQQQEVDESVSDSTSKAESHSQSPSSFANIITFKQKNEKSMERRLKNIKNQKQHKYSSMERLNKGSSQLTKDIITHTDDNFYKNHRFLRPKAQIQSDADIHAPHPISKLIKKSVNNLSMNALKSLNNGSTLPKIENESVTIDHFSNSAKANIDKINNRISNIQQKLKYHNANIEPIVESPNMERNVSKSRSNSNSSQHVSLKKVAKPNKPNERSSNASSNAIKKNISHDKIKNSNFSELSRPQTKKINEKPDAIYEETEFKPHQSKRKEARYAEGPVVRQSPKKVSNPSSNRFSNFEENGVKASRSKDGNKVLKERQEKKQDKKVPQRGNGQNKEVEPQSQSQSSQEEGEKFQPHPHEARQAKPLARKFKDWKESSPTHNVLKSKELERKISKQGLSEKIRESDSKQTVIRNKKYKAANKPQQAKPSNSNEKLQEKSKKNEEEVQYPLTQEKKSRSGKIKKNRIVAKKSNHREAKPRGKLFDNNSNGSRVQSLRNEQHQQEEQYQENDEQGIRNSQQSYENPSRNIETPSTNGVSENKMRKTLGYFKVNELCYRGARTSQRDRGSSKLKDNQASFYDATHQQKDYEKQQENEMNGQGQRQAENDSQRSSESQFVPKCTKKEQDERVEKEESQGWRNKSQEENEMLPQEILHEDENVRKNSIEQKLEDKEEEELADPVHEVRTTNVMHTNDEPEIAEQRSQTTKDVCVFEPYQSAHEENHSQALNQKVETAASPAPTKKESKKTNKTNKTKKQKKQAKEAKAKPAATQPQIDLEEQTCKEYSEYLEFKISNDLCKAAQLQKTEIQYHDSEYRVNVFNCQSEVSIKEGQQQAEMQFTDFQSSKPVTLEQPRQEKVQEDGEEEEEEEDSVDEEESAQAEPSQLEAIKSKTISGREECEPEEEKQETSINNTPQTPLVLVQKQPSIVKESSHKQSITPTPTPIVSASVNNSTVKQSPASPKNSSFVSQPAPTPTPSESKSKQPQYDNVYSQSKKPSPKFVEIGVQKQMTNQVSIQTDTHHRDDTFFIGKKSSLFNITEQPIRQSTTPENQQPTEPIDHAQSEFEATVRNNYLSQRKNLSFSQEKSKREIIRAKITNQILSHTRNQQMQKFQEVMIDKADAEILKEEGAVASLSTVYNQGVFISERDLQVELIKTKFTKYLKVLEILAERGSWILTRLFEDLKGVLQEKAFGVWVCKDFQWECYVVDDNIQVDQANLPLYTLHTGNQKWANVLQKAIAKAMGGYEQLLKAETGDLFMLLTGCNSISVKVKEDPSKNGKLLQLIGDCQRKNYIVHAQKNIDRMRQDRDRQSVYYVLAVKKLSSDEEPILEISQDGRESFWMRLSKFTQEFSKVEILQLRVNHLFTHIDIGVGKESQLTVIELAFAESGQGCVTLTYVDHIAPLTAYLYREEKSRVLKLVGQAREKQKSHLFFECNFNEGKYYVFAQTKERPARLCYYGENNPSLRITEQIHNDGLKNEVAEYLPIKESKQPKRREMQQTWNDWKGKAPRFKDNFVQSRLRQNFVEYIMGQTKRKEAQF